MKPRNKIQREVVALSSVLPPITSKQKEWGITHSYTAKERTYAKIMYRYFVLSSRVKGWQVCRFFQIRKQRQVYEVIEPMRLWFNAEGHMEVEAMNRFCMSGRIDSWIVDSDLSLKQVHTSYRDYTLMLPISASKVTSTLLILKRNGLKRSFHNIQPRDVIEGLLKNNMFETLWKCKQYSLLHALAYDWNVGYNDTEKMAAVKVALRHGYKITDGRMWLDMIALLKRAHKDIRNPKFVCPIDLQKTHDEALELYHKHEEKQRKIAERKKLLEDKKVAKKYEVARKCFMGMVLSDGKVIIKVLPTVKAVMQEGEAMHHCVFAAEYYKRLDSLLLTAKVNGERAETIEVDLKRYQLVQSRGVCNQNSKYHDEIVNLVNENMSVIRKFNKVV
ncbi:PcfJ domain-containing protein [Prevotella sp. KH2C16]|uniref:PcfJ domain-containing protein n=1 Tax=Prevotella sp. KH2C16 TaxID=1855325 RepID=UPI0008EAAF15|nr:PcfJ domain-containing protein [Prevotella sp. KH2C16]SFG55997.1 PcfJ-like protein [Prevotella sp. KH2C16]